MRTSTRTVQLLVGGVALVAVAACRQPEQTHERIAAERPDQDVHASVVEHADRVTLESLGDLSHAPPPMTAPAVPEREGEALAEHGETREVPGDEPMHAKPPEPPAPASKAKASPPAPAETEGP
jgi:hypothetical protein